MGFFQMCLTSVILSLLASVHFSLKAIREMLLFGPEDGWLHTNLFVNNEHSLSYKAGVNNKKQ